MATIIRGTVCSNVGKDRSVGALAGIGIDHSSVTDDLCPKRRRRRVFHVEGHADRALARLEQGQQGVAPACSTDRISEGVPSIMVRIRS